MSHPNTMIITVYRPIFIDIMIGNKHAKMKIVENEQILEA